MKKNKASAVVLVFNSENNLALQLRAAHDDSYPGHWDFSAAGGIEAHETLVDAAIRELMMSHLKKEQTQILQHRSEMR